MFKFNRDKIFGLFVSVFAMSTFTVLCQGANPVLIGYVTVDGVGTPSPDSEIPKNDGKLVSATQPYVITPDSEGDVVVELGALDGYILKGNVINFGDMSHLLDFRSIPPMNCDLYVRAIKIKDGFGNKIVYNPNTSNPYLDTGWILYNGQSTFDWLAYSTGQWQTYAVRYSSENTKNNGDIERVILDKSNSIDGINRYTLIDKSGNVVVPDIS